MACAADTTENTFFSGVTVKEFDTIVAKRRSLGQLKSYLERTIDEVQSCCLMAESNASNSMIHTLNRAWERNPYIMYPMKIQNREFFGLNTKFSMCRDYTKNFSKIAPPGKGEK